MIANLIRPTHKDLTACIDYFLFLDNKAGQGSYMTFPNTNICLALYGQNHVDWDRKQNYCHIIDGATSATSRLYGFHQRPFCVSYEGEVRQICILFKAEGISAFTNIPINALDLHDDPLLQLFGNDSVFLYDHLFIETCQKKQTELLEGFLLKRIQPQRSSKEMYIKMLKEMNKEELDNRQCVNYFSRQLQINPSTLYRNFLHLFGQSPQDLVKVIRFRNSMKAILSQQSSLTDIAYRFHFTDQSHFIKDIKSFTGMAPKNLRQKVSDVSGTLIWSKN